ncbi:solute carrier family 22 member 18 isoform X2 [Phycodurus eques]|uniref:solute carrier family 22 member 18 isoform X2 n=1 Tax=Phycodurus eques TaxID=693459 RepID=UPI002ACDD921|nr:solute carrier family 22 member 18 isoform X2 [Phycodurus eques]XP_061520062.1 solute carrier family 22 member 18 isoform X2 [Phycodurus eques]XP_061520071.1 solute carrier family 22 member 18 isoform X2 [Phycodurus eques]XP_061520080.1 solute carrier family 22 member 18 isoform X2 [Phycodurus eques]XP_061520088.1 solute carrier family 22 member 18 isoform X2 [Phycodurus eques]
MTAPLTSSPVPLSLPATRLTCPIQKRKLWRSISATPLPQDSSGPPLLHWGADSFLSTRKIPLSAFVLTSVVSMTVKNKAPLPLIDPSFEPLCNVQIFTKLDLRNAYHLIPIREGDKWKTAFNTPLRHRAPGHGFWINQRPRSFQTINDILCDMLNRFVFVYLDDIVIFSRSPDVHHQHVCQVLQRLLENRLFVKPEKCEFHLSSIHFLGYIIAKGQLQPEIQAVVDWPIPSTRKELQRFLGFANFYRRFIFDNSKVAIPLTSLTSTSSPAASQAFERLKELFTSAPILRHSDPSLQFIVEVDASDMGAGAVLSQRDPVSQKLHPCPLKVSPPHIQTSWHSNRHRLRQRSSVLLPCLEDVLQGGGRSSQSVFRLPPPIQRPDRAGEPEPGICSSLCCRSQSCLLEHLPSVG